MITHVQFYHATADQSSLSRRYPKIQVGCTKRKTVYPVHAAPCVLVLISPCFGWDLLLCNPLPRVAIWPWENAFMIQIAELDKRTRFTFLLKVRKRNKVKERIPWGQFQCKSFENILFLNRIYRVQRKCQRSWIQIQSSWAVPEIMPEKRSFQRFMGLAGEFVFTGRRPLRMRDERHWWLRYSGNSWTLVDRYRQKPI